MLGRRGERLMLQIVGGLGGDGKGGEEVGAGREGGVSMRVLYAQELLPRGGGGGGPTPSLRQNIV